MRRLGPALLVALFLIVGCGASGGTAAPDAADAAGPGPDVTGDVSNTDVPMIEETHVDTAPVVDVPTGSDVAPEAAAETNQPEVAPETGGAEMGLPTGLKAIMIGAPGAMTPGDKVMSDRLKARGFVVTLVSDAAVTTAQAAMFDLVVISSSAESAPLGTKVRDVTIPVVSIENGEYGPMRMTGTTRATDWDQTMGQTSVRITMPAHPLAAGLSGLVTISSAPGELGWGVPGPAAVIIAEMADSPTHKVIFGYLAGAQMVGGTAPARRVGYAVREALAANLTADGLKLFDAAVTWALSK
jgi:hypothetical protein